MNIKMKKEFGTEYQPRQDNTAHGVIQEKVKASSGLIQEQVTKKTVLEVWVILHPYIKIFSYYHIILFSMFFSDSD